MYNKVIILIENNDQIVVKGEVLARSTKEETADYILRTFFTLDKAAQDILKGETTLHEENGE